MGKRNINSSNILTIEDKQYLRRVCRYLASIGMQDGIIEIIFDSYGHFDFSEINWEKKTHFSNNFKADIPDGLKPILEKISDFAQKNNLYREPEEDNLINEGIEFEIDCKSQEISVKHWWSFYGTGDSNGIGWDEDDGKKIFKEWETKGVFNGIKIPKEKILTVRYSGGGDAGYLEDFFVETPTQVPADVENWCYRELEDNFSGWEDNEGSDGEFVFDFKNKTIELSHIYNIEKNEMDTIYEESFKQ
jgi:hypothetical protein